MKRSSFTLLLMGFLILSGFGLRLSHLGGHSLWFDELLELDIAQGSLTQIDAQLTRHAAMPLDYYLLHFWIKLGRQESWVRLPALFFGMLSIPLIYLLAKQLFNRRTAYLAAILLTYSSFAVEYSQEARPYALLLFLVVFTYLGIWRAYTTGQSRCWILVIGGLAGASLTHYFTLFMLLPIALFVGFQQVHHLKRKIFWQHSGWFLLCLLVLLLIFGVYGRLGVLRSVGGRFSTVVRQPESLTVPAGEKPNRGSGPPLELNFLVEKILMPLATHRPSTLLVYQGFFLAAVLSLIKRQPSKNRTIPYQRHASPSILLLLGWLILPTILIYIFLLQRGTFFAIRYILYTLPAYLILVASGLDRLSGFVIGLIPQWQTRSFQPSQGFTLRNLTAYPLILFGLAPLLLAQFDQLATYYRSDSYEDWRAVSQLLVDEASPGDTVIAVRAESTLNWYYPPASRPFGTFWQSEPIWKEINAHSRRWFILSSYSFKRDQGLRDWLANQQAVKIAIDRRVEVYFHQEGQSFGDMLAQVKTFALPQHALTYAVLAEQFRQVGDLETSRAFYQKAIDLARTPEQRAGYEAYLAALSSRSIGQ